MTARSAPSSQKRVAAGEGVAPLGQGVERQQLELRRREEPRWPPSITRSSVVPERGGDRTKIAGGFFGRAATRGGSGGGIAGSRSRAASPRRPAGGVGRGLARHLDPQARHRRGVLAAR